MVNQGCLIAVLRMLLVNTNVFDTCCQVTLLEWAILRSDDNRLRLEEFYKVVSLIFVYL